jgi:hypothetical protein
VCSIRRIRIVSIDHQEGIGLDIAKHGLDDMPFASPRFGDDLRSLVSCDRGRLVRRAVVVNEDLSRRQGALEVSDDLANRLLLIEARDEDYDARDRKGRLWARPRRSPHHHSSIAWTLGAVPIGTLAETRYRTPSRGTEATPGTAGGAGRTGRTILN